MMGTLMDLILPTSGFVEKISYGDPLFRMPPSGTGGYLPKTTDKQYLAEALSMLPLGAPASKGVTKAANVTADALVQQITRNPLATAPKALEEAAMMSPLSRIFRPEQVKPLLSETKILDEANNPRMMFHGTPKTPSRLEPQERGFISLSPETDFANRYAGQEYTIEVLGENPNVWPVYANVKKPFDYENPSHVKMVMDKVKYPKNVNKDTVEENISLGNWNFIEDKKVQQAIKELGFDSFYMKEMGVKNLGVFDPQNVKSAISDPLFTGLLEPKKKKP
jgi:hypothetical protein